jgi:hypothetical protein
MSDRAENIESFAEMCADHIALATQPSNRFITGGELNTIHAAISALALAAAMLLQLAPDDE